MPSVDLGAEVTLGQQASVRRNPAQAHRLGMLPRRELPGPLGMLSGLGSQRPTLLGDALLHPCNIQLHLCNSLSQLGHLRSERVALRPVCSTRASRSGLLGSGSATEEPEYPPTREVYPPPRTTPWLLHPSHHPCWARPIRSLVADASGARSSATRPDPRSVLSATGEN